MPRGSVLTGFGLVRPSIGTISFNYSSLALGLVPEWCDVHEQHTAFNEEGGGNVAYLDRHRVMAPKGHFLVGFQINRNPGLGGYRYTYWTREAEAPSTSVRITRPLSAGTQDDRHHLHIQQLIVHSASGEVIPLRLICASPLVMRGSKGRTPHVAIDGNRETTSHNHYGEDTPYGQEDHWMEFALTSDQAVPASITLVHRRDDIFSNRIVIDDMM